MCRQQGFTPTVLTMSNELARSALHLAAHTFLVPVERRHASGPATR